jgi:hypothetical protein
VQDVSLTRSAFVAIVALGAPATGWLVALLLSGNGTPLPAGAFVLLPALLAGAAGIQLRRAPAQIIVGTVVAGVLGGVSLILTLAWLGETGVLG